MYHHVSPSQFSDEYVVDFEGPIQDYLKASLSDEENYQPQKDTLDRASWQGIGSLVAITSMWESLEALNGGSTALNHTNNFYNAAAVLTKGELAVR